MLYYIIYTYICTSHVIRLIKNNGNKGYHRLPMSSGSHLIMPKTLVFGPREESNLPSKAGARWDRGYDIGVVDAQILSNPMS